MGSTRLLEHPHPLWEAILSLHMLHAVRMPPRMADWRTDVHRRERRDDAAARRLLDEVAPAHGSFPDFLTPAAGTPSFGGQLETVLATPRPQIRSQAGASGIAPALLDGGSARGMRGLGDALQRYHDAHLAPWWDTIATGIGADADRRERQMASGGLAALFAGLGHGVRWDPPVLHTIYPFERDIHLGGRGLTLIPSWFCHRMPVTFIDPELPPVLVFPIAGPGTADRSGVAPLLGETRARALRELRAPRSTTDLARRLDVSPGVASRHARVLREAGLVSSVRDGPAVIHVLTRLGSSLLAGRADGGPPR